MEAKVDDAMFDETVEEVPNPLVVKAIVEVETEATFESDVLVALDTGLEAEVGSELGLVLSTIGPSGQSPMDMPKMSIHEK